MKRIKLENMVDKGFDRQTGNPISEVTVEYVCEACRHLVNPEDKFCWKCGMALEQSNLVEHYQRGEGLSDADFEARKPKKG